MVLLWRDIKDRVGAPLRGAGKRATKAKERRVIDREAEDIKRRRSTWLVERNECRHVQGEQGTYLYGDDQWQEHNRTLQSHKAKPKLTATRPLFRFSLSVSK